MKHHRRVAAAHPRQQIPQRCLDFTILNNVQARSRRRTSARLFLLSFTLAVALPSSSGGRAMLAAIRLPSSAVNVFACRASASFSRE
jgi:hypothetical protein